MKQMRESLERIGSKNRKGRNEAKVIHQGVLDAMPHGRPPSAPRSPPSCRFVLLTSSHLQLVPEDLVRCWCTWTSCHVQMLQEIDEVKAAADRDL